MKLSLMALATWFACATPVSAQTDSAAPDNGNFDVKPAVRNDLRLVSFRWRPRGG